MSTNAPDPTVVDVRSELEPDGADVGAVGTDVDTSPAEPAQTAAADASVSEQVDIPAGAGGAAPAQFSGPSPSAASPSVAPARGRLDSAAAAATDLARQAAVEVAQGEVGAHLGAVAEGDRVVTHAFEAVLAGYSGWHWAVTVSRASRSRVVTVDEVVLLPGGSALLPPPWVPWSQRLQAGDLSPGDLLPADEQDDRLVASYTAPTTGSPVDPDAPGEDRQVAVALGLGRVRVLSRDGRLDAADRWFASAGPDTDMARQAPGRCGTCGFLVSVAGALQAGFGVCANEYSPADGRAVSVEYGCGAHSEAVAAVEAVAESSVYESDVVLIEAN